MNMLGKKKYTLLGLIAMMALVAVAAMWPNTPAPAPFGQYPVYSAAGVYDASIAPEDALSEVAEWGNLADWFHRGVMGHDDAALAQEEAEADAYFQATFGANYTPGSLFAFGVDPRNEYRAYFISGMNVPPEGWVVRDGGFMAMLDDGGWWSMGITTSRSPLRVKAGSPIRSSSIMSLPVQST